MDNKTYKQLGKKRVISMYEDAELKAKKAINLADEVKAENKNLQIKLDKSNTKTDEVKAENQILQIKAKKAINLADEVKAENKNLQIKLDKTNAKVDEVKAENKVLQIELDKSNAKADTAKSLGEEALDILNAVDVLKNNAETDKKEVDAKSKDNIGELLNLHEVKKAICNSPDDSLFKIFEDGVNEAIQTGRDRNKILEAKSERLERKIHNCSMVEKYLNLLRSDFDGADW